MCLLAYTQSPSCEFLGCSPLASQDQHIASLSSSAFSTATAQQQQPISPVRMLMAYACDLNVDDVCFQVGFVASFVSKFSDTVSSEVGKVCHNVQVVCMFCIRQCIDCWKQLVFVLAD